MKLQEFDLDAPRLARPERARFSDETRHISALYEACFPGLRTRRGWKVLIECVERVSDDRVRNLLGVLVCQSKFDFDNYWRSSCGEKKQAALDAVHRGALLVATHEHWPSGPFEKARSCVVERNLTNTWVWKQKWNPGRGYLAQVLCDHGIDSFRAWIVVLDKHNTEIARQDVIETKPNEFHFAHKLGQLTWIAPQSVAVFAKDGSQVALLDLQPRGHSDDQNSSSAHTRRRPRRRHLRSVP